MSEQPTLGSDVVVDVLLRMGIDHMSINPSATPTTLSGDPSELPAVLGRALEHTPMRGTVQPWSK